MNKLILGLAVSLCFVTFAKADVCKVHLADHSSALEVENGINYYDYKETFEKLGYELVDIQEEADLTVTLEIEDEEAIGIMGMEYSIGGWGDFLDLNWLPDENYYNMAVKNLSTGEYREESKTILGNLTNRKVKRKLKGLIRKLPKDC